MKTLIAVLLVAVICASSVRAQTGSPPPVAAGEAYPSVPENYFNDYAGITSQTTRVSLNEELVDFDRKTRNQVFVAIFKRRDSTAPLADYCGRIFRKWGVGRSGRNNGVVLFVFTDDNSMEITTGWDMERVLPEQERQRILNQVIAPEFQKHDFDAGLASGVEAILKSLRDNSFSTDF